MSTNSFTLDGMSVTLLTTLLVSLIKPLVERLPFAAPTAPAHNAAVRLLSLILSALSAALLLVAQGQLTLATLGPTLPSLLGLALAGFGSGHVLYKVTTTSGGSIGAIVSSGMGALVGELAPLQQAQVARVAEQVATDASAAQAIVAAAPLPAPIVTPVASALGVVAQDALTTAQVATTHTAPGA